MCHIERNTRSRSKVTKRGRTISYPKNRFYDRASPNAVANFESRCTSNCVSKASIAFESKSLCSTYFYLQVDYTGDFTSFNPHRYGQHFLNKVANPKDILLFHRKKNFRAATVDIDRPKGMEDRLRGDDFKVEDFIKEYLDAQNLELLPENGLSDAVKNFVEKDDKEAIREYV